MIDLTRIITLEKSIRIGWIGIEARFRCLTAISDIVFWTWKTNNRFDHTKSEERWSSLNHIKMSREVAYVQKIREMIAAVKTVIRAIVMVIVVLLEWTITYTLSATYIIETVMHEEPTKNSQSMSTTITPKKKLILSFSSSSCSLSKPRS